MVNKKVKIENIKFCLRNVAYIRNAKKRVQIKILLKRTHIRLQQGVHTTNLGEVFCWHLFCSKLKDFGS